MRFTVFFSALLFASVMLLTPAAGPASAQSGQDNPVIKQMEAFRDAFNAGDAETLARLYHPEAALLPPGNKALIGRDAIQENFAKAFASGVNSVDFRIVELELVGPATAYEIAETRIETAEQILFGRTLYIWINVDGNWLIKRDIYHILGMEPKGASDQPDE